MSEMVERTCNCAVCVYGREVEQQVAMLPEDQRAFFSDLYDRLCHAEMDRDWSQHKLNQLRGQSTAALGSNR